MFPALYLTVLSSRASAASNVHLFHRLVEVSGLIVTVPALAHADARQFRHHRGAAALDLLVTPLRVVVTIVYVRSLSSPRICHCHRHNTEPNAARSSLIK